MQTPLQSLWLSFDTALHSDRKSYGESGKQILPSDKEIQHGLENFLTCDNNREAVGRLDFHGFVEPLTVGTNQLTIKNSFETFCTNEVKFRELWLLLVRLCNSILPMGSQFLKQQEWLEGADRGQLQPAANGGNPMFDVSATFNAMPGNIGGSMQVLMEQLGQVNPSQLISTLGTLVQPILAGIDDPNTKQSVAQILDGITGLAAATNKP